MCKYCQNVSYNNDNLDEGEIALGNVKAHYYQWIFKKQMYTGLVIAYDNVVFEQHIPISYCPMCGRKLVDE